MPDDDLRFGDVTGSSDGGPPDVIEWFVTAIVGLILLYVLLAVINSLFIPIPFIP